MRQKKAKTSVSVGETLADAKTAYAAPTQICYTTYDANGAATQTVGQWEALPELGDDRGIAWIDVRGIHDIAAMEKISRQFSLHPLVTEDILNTAQRPKFEEFDQYLFIVMRAPFLAESGQPGQKGTQEVDFEQFSILFGKNWVLSCAESERDLFAPIRDRLMNGKGRLRGLGPDYLAYALLDVLVDQYFTVLEQIGDAIEFFDEVLVHDPGPAMLRQIHLFKRQLLYLHKAVWPVREIISSFERCESGLCSRGTGPYLRDVYDHIIQAIDTVETYRDLISGMLDIYLSSISYRLNEVMKVLTIISTLFIPLTFIAGVYGMNFEYMPELKWEYGYFAVWAVMLTIAVIMLCYFRRRQWL